MSSPVRDKGRLIWVIRYLEPGVFELYDPNGVKVEAGPRPKKLSVLAFVSGADEVKHDYDLRLAE